MTKLHIKTATSIHHIEASAWNELSAGKPFQSHAWYVYGERVMADCPPVYLLVYCGDRLIARASFWLVRNEPIPKMAGILREPAKKLIKRYPLLMCKSPLASVSGMILPEGPLQNDILDLITQKANDEASARDASFVIFDFLGETNTVNWPSTFRAMQFSEPGTIMQNRWDSLKDYLSESANKKNRRHYKHIMQEIETLGVTLQRCNKVPDINAALEIIENIERRHGAFPNPWKRAMLENMEIIHGTWLDARIGERLVGGMLILNDNGTQTTTLPGLAEDVSHVYFLLLFKSLEVAFEEKAEALRWGSGAYEAKRRLGFQLEPNHFIHVSGANWLTRQMMHFLATH